MSLTSNTIDNLLQGLSTEALANLKLCAEVLARDLEADTCYIVALDEEDYSLAAKSGKTENMLEDKIKNLLKHSAASIETLSSEDLLCLPIVAAKHSETEGESERRHSADSYGRLKGFVVLRGSKIDALTALKTKPGKAAMGLLCNLLEMRQTLIVAGTDKLTGALNRRYMDAALETCFEQAQRTNSPFSVIMVDLDYFKHVNDTYGHLVGDEVLRATAEIVRQNLGKDDILGRYGGEEFVVMLKQTSSAQAQNVAEKLRLGILDAKILGDKRDITASLGVASFPEHADSARSLVDKADKALYRAKQTGRNKHELWDENMEDMPVKKDRQQLFFSQDNAKDALKIQALYRLMNIAGLNHNLYDKINLALDEMLTVTAAADITMFLTDAGKITDKFMVVEPGHGTPYYNDSAISEVLESSNSLCIVDWDRDITDAATGMADWQSIALAPAIVAGKTVGVLYASVPVKTKEFKADELAFLENAAIILASMVQEGG